MADQDQDTANFILDHFDIYALSATEQDYWSLASGTSGSLHSTPVR